MKGPIIIPEDLMAQIEDVLTEVRARARAECVLLADVSGQLIEVQGKMEAFDPVLVAALAAGQLAAMDELARQIGDRSPRRHFLHEGEKRSLYISSVEETFLLVVVFSADVPVGLVRLFVRRATERLHPLVTDFEEWMSRPGGLVETGLSSALSEELDRAFEGL